MWDDLKRTIKILNERIWENKATWPTVEAWLANFVGAKDNVEVEKLHALYLLAQFHYFGARETRALLRALFRDIYRYPIIERIRKQNNDTIDEDLIKDLFLQELQATRFLGVGNPSESGTHLLYYFRQENGLPKNLFINSHELFKQAGAADRNIRTPSIRRYVFLDDLCGSGQQAATYSKELLVDLKRLEPKASVAYYVLFATTSALSHIRDKTLFDEVSCVFDLDPSFKCFEEGSRYFSEDDNGIDRQKARDICLHYGERLWLDHPLGYRDSQLLIGFHHNTPDNTLPVIWFDEPGSPWRPIFKRYPKELW